MLWCSEFSCVFTRLLLKPENVVALNICIPCFGAGYFLFYFDSLLYFEFNFLVSLFLICPCNISINVVCSWAFRFSVRFAPSLYMFCLLQQAIKPSRSVPTWVQSLPATQHYMGGVWVCLRDFPPSVFVSFTACSQRKLYFHISVKIGGVVIVEIFFLHTLLFAL